MQTGHRAATLLMAAVLGSTLVGAAAAEGSVVTESIDESGLKVVSTTHERFTQMYPGETVSWYMDVSSSHQPADLGLRLMPAGKMDAQLSIFDCTTAEDCTALITDRDFAADEDLVVEGFEESMNLRIDVTAGENLSPEAAMSLGALVSGTDASVSVGAPGTDTEPVVTPADPSSPRPALTDAGSGSQPGHPGSGGSVSGGSGSNGTAGDGSMGDNDAPVNSDQSAGTSNHHAWPMPVAGASAYPGATEDGLRVQPQTLSPYSEPVFRGILAATGGNVLGIGLLGLGLIGAGGAVIWRRKSLSLRH